MKTAALSTGAGCHLRRAAFAGFVGGYVMALAGYWLEAVLGVSDLDLAHSSLRYVSGGKQGWWVVGIIFHLIDSILLGLLYAAVFYRRADVLEKRWGADPGWRARRLHLRHRRLARARNVHRHAIHGGRSLRAKHPLSAPGHR